MMNDRLLSALHQLRLSGLAGHRRAAVVGLTSGCRKRPATSSAMPSSWS